MRLPDNMVYDKTTKKIFVATPLDIIRFNKAQLTRARNNLFNAQKRGDRKAAANIQRKITIYQYTISMAKRHIDDGEYIAEQIAKQIAEAENRRRQFGGYVQNHD